MRSLKPIEQKFWERYARTCGIANEGSLTVRASMPGDASIADELVGHYLSGAKTAGSGLVRDYEAAGDALPTIGEYWIILDSGGVPRCVARTVKVEINLFCDVTEKIAIAEADGSLAGWRKAHIEFFTPFLERLGIPDLEQALIVTEYFEVWRGI